MCTAFLSTFALIVWSIVLPTGRANADEPQMTREQIEQQIAKELPPGTSRAQVVAFLNAHHVENSSSSAAAPADEVLAIYRNVKGSTAIVTKAVQVVFRFRDGALESHTTAEKLTGP